MDKLKDFLTGAALVVGFLAICAILGIVVLHSIGVVPAAVVGVVGGVALLVYTAARS